MKKYIALLILAVCPFIGLKATHFPVLTFKSVKCIEHNDTSIYVLTQEGLEVINKATLKKTVYNMVALYFLIDLVISLIYVLQNRTTSLIRQSVITMFICKA